jgi:cell pole-organizing protein PopZ
MAAGNTPQGAKTSGSGDDDLSMEEILQSIRRIIAEDDGDTKKPAAAANAAPVDSSVLELTEMVADDGSVVSLKADEKPVEPVKEAASADILSSIDEALTPEKPTDMSPAKPEAKPVEQPVAAPAAASQDDIDAMFAAPALAAPVAAAPAAPAPAPTVAVAAPAAPKPAAPAAPAPTVAAAAPVTPKPPAPAAPAAKPSPVETADSLLSAEASSAASSAIKKLKDAEPELPPLVTTPSPHFRSGNSVEDMVADMLRPMMKSWLDANLPQIVERIVEREVKKLTKYLTDNES